MSRSLLCVAESYIRDSRELRFMPDRLQLLRKRIYIFLVPGQVKILYGHDFIVTVL